MKLIAPFLLFLFCSLIACQQETQTTPKPRAYPKITYPNSDSTFTFNQDYCDFSFQQPHHTKFIRDTLFFDAKPLHPCWFDIYYPAWGGKVHFSYVPITKEKSLTDLTNDAYRLTHKHNVRAEFINDYMVHKPNQVHGIIFEVDGPVASPFQFFLTDSTNHYLRGALYFDTNPNQDSLKPIVEYVKTDIVEMINTFRWKNY